MRRLTLCLAVAAGLLSGCAASSQIDPYPEDCITPTAPCPAGEE